MQQEQITMVMPGFLRRAFRAALVMSAASLMGCAERKDAGDKVPRDSGTTARATGGTTGVNTAPSARVTAEALAALDAGNAAYRAKDYPAALAGYEKAARIAPQHPAPWFGIYMVAQVRKDSKAADAALAEIRRRSDAPSAAHNLDGAAATGERARTGTDPSTGA